MSLSPGQYGIGDKLKVKRVGPDTLELEVGGQKAIVLTENLATVVAKELPADRSNEFFAEMEEKFIKNGKVSVVVKAHKDIKQYEEVRFVLDINRYVGDTGGVRVTPTGIIF